jgi:ABC-2 type transport system permease protein
MSALTGLMRKELYHIRRDRQTLAVIILMPVIQVLLFGYAIRTDVRHVRLAVVDPAPGPASLALRARFEGAGLFEVVAVTPRAADIDPLFRDGRVQQALIFESSFDEDLARGGPATVLIVTDSTEPNMGTAMQNFARAVIQRYAGDRGQPAQGGIRIAARMLYNPTGESSNLFVPGLMALVLTLISALMTAISLAREKELGTIEALLVSPLRPWQVIAGKVVPYLIVGFVSVVLVIAEGRFLFDVPLRGSVILLLFEGLLFILVSLSVGVLISSRTSSQRVAMMGVLVSTMLPTMLLSGFIFPPESMPAPLRMVSQIVPATWFVEISRGIMLKGVGLSHLWQETLVLGGMAAVLLVLSARSFHARLDSTGGA